MRRTTQMGKTTFFGVITLLGISLAGAATAGVNQWTSAGPEGGLIASLAIDPSDPATLYAGTLEDRLFKSTDDGATWVRADRGLSGSAHWIGAVAIDPSSSATVYAGTLRGVFKSTDSGLSWSPTDGTLGRYVRALAIDPQAPATLYAGITGGVYRTTDGGDAWSQVAVADEVSGLVVDPSRSGVVYAAARDDGMLKSVDGGDTWTPINNGLESAQAYAVAIDPQVPSTVYAGTSHGLFRSVDGGGLWTSVGPNDSYFSDIAVSPRDPTVLWTASSGITGVLWRSTDGGAIWSSLTTAPYDLNVRLFVPDPRDADTVLIGCVQGMWRSEDGGRSWQPRNRGLVTTKVRTVAVDPDNPWILYAGTDDTGAWKSTDGGRSWIPISVGLGTFYSIFDLVIDPLDPTTLYLATLRGVYKSTDGGLFWHIYQNALTRTYTHALAIDPHDPATLYAATDRDGVWKTTDGGLSWFPINNGLANTVMEALAIDPWQPSTIYAGTNTGGAFRSTDGGLSWLPINNGLDITFVNVLTVDPTNPAVLYAGSAIRGRLFRSSNRGNSWRRLAGGLPVTDLRGLAVDPRDGATLYAATLRRGIYRSVDAGNSWTQLPETGMENLDVATLTLARDGLVTLHAGTFGGGVVSLTEVTPCVPDDVTLCLHDGRFQLAATWQDFQGQTGAGQAVPLTNETGYFWFFNDENIELVAKVLDGRVFNDHFWVFYASLSNVAFTLTVTDTQTGNVRTYTNPAGTFASVGDTVALSGEAAVGGSGATASAAASPAREWQLQAATRAQAKGACIPSATDLCLQDDRFRAEVRWRDFQDHTGRGQIRPLTRDTGSFWFFDPDNLELVIKVLDGTALNGHHWVFFGSLSNVEFTITVHDTLTGKSKTYSNPAGQFASIGDTRAFAGP